MFFCQTDSFAKEFETVVESIKPSSRKLELVSGGPKVSVKGLEVVCKDTVLFPEGGGQNTDKGRLGNLPVLQVTRDGSKAVHFVDITNHGDVSLKEGDSVLQTVDWDRRFDNMQQHSGQHLLSAILEKEYICNTLSWWMAENSEKKVGVSYVELDKTLNILDITRLEERCNEIVMSSTPVTVTVHQPGDDAGGHTRGLPADHVGPVRLVTIPGVDSNLCCGTHVSNSSQLQVIKLVGGMETKKGKNYLYFLVGGRVAKYLNNCLEREKRLTKLLNNAPEDHIDLVDKMQKGLKVALKNGSSLLKEVAVTEARKFKQNGNSPGYCVVHRKEGDADFINTFLKELDDNSILSVVTVGDGSGQLVVTGPQEKVQLVANRLCVLLEGKGGGKGGRFNARVNNLKNVDQVEALVKDCVD